MDIWIFGFSLNLRSTEKIRKKILAGEYEELRNILIEKGDKFSINLIGTSLFITIGEISSDELEILPANLENFMEIMLDGSVRIRILLASKDNNSVQMNYNINTLLEFERVYKEFILKYVYKDFISFYKYEKLTVLKQFTPSIEVDSEKYKQCTKQYQIRIQQKYGKQKVISGVRIPRTGLLRIDREYFNRKNGRFSLDRLNDLLFQSYNILLGYIEPIQYK